MIIECIYCNGEGKITVERRVTREMAMDANEPDVEGWAYFEEIDCEHCRGDGWIRASDATYLLDGDDDVETLD